MKKQSALLQRLILATILGTGFAIAWVFLGSWLEEIGEETIRSSRTYEQLLFTPEGTAVIMVYTGDRYQLREYHDLAGTPLTFPDDQQWSTGASLPAQVDNPNQPGPASWDERIRSFADARRPPDFWFLVSDGRRHGSAYLTAYDSLTHARVGFLGRNGFRENALPVEDTFPFSGNVGLQQRIPSAQQYLYLQGQYPQNVIPQGVPGDIHAWMVYVHADDNKIYQVNLNERTVQVALEGLPIRSAGLFLFHPHHDGPPLHRLAVRTDDEVLMLDESNQVLRRSPLPPELRDQSFTWAVTPTGEALAYVVELSDFRRPGTRYHIFRIDPAGNLTSRQDLTLKGNEPAPFIGWAGGVIAPVPFVVDGMIGIGGPIFMLMNGEAESYQQAFHDIVTVFWPSALIAHLVATALAWICYRRQVRYGAGRLERIVWPLFVFVFGLPGWIGYRFGRSWPVLERCPSCGAQVPQDRIHCAACQVEFPLPAPNGTEIFA